MYKAIIKLSKSLNFKIMFTIVIAILVLLAYMEITTFYTLSLYKHRTLENYRNSIEMNMTFWDNSISMLNQELVVMSSDNNEPYLRYIASGVDSTKIETSKVLLQKSMQKISHLHGDKFKIFAYLPDKELYIHTNRLSYEVSGKSTLDDAVKQYIKTDKKAVDLKWKPIVVENMLYFIQVYPKESGYVGAVIAAEEVLHSFVQKDNENVDHAAFVDGENTVLEIGQSSDDQMTTATIVIEPKYLSHKIHISVAESKIFSDSKAMVLIAISVAIMAVMVIAANIKIEKKVVIDPLNKLREAMDKFSFGTLDIRLDEDYNSEEINSLNQSFNRMARQIMGLKIDIYESELKRQKTEGSFLRIQLQPHFYSNILNLIHGLSQMKDYESIQKITKNTSDYFRYLLSSKATLVPLADELKCVEAYCEIQKTRYMNMFTFSSRLSVDVTQFKVPPLLIQTFIENSIKHNVTMVPLLMVEVVVYEKKESCLCIEIIDNGIGFPQELLEKINQGISISKSGKFIGITNVYERIRLVYGDNAKLKIQCSDGMTKVIIDLVNSNGVDLEE